MAPSEGGRGQEDKCWFGRHLVKLLNLCLLLYLCSGAFVFDYLSESFSNQQQVVGGGGRGREIERKLGVVDCSWNRSRNMRSREGLRKSFAKRMWDITNKLNILYEANWTAQVLDELFEFERRLEELDSVVRDESSTVEGVQEEIESASGRVQASALSRRPGAHLKKLALIHSAAILTGIGSTKPLGEPQTIGAKLIMLIYVSLGIPLLICTVACTGHSVAKSGLNTLVCLHHYGFLLPIYYLCHTCGLRWLFYCCFCCCCLSKCRLCCCCGVGKRSPNGPTTICSSSCCDTSATVDTSKPKLRLPNKEEEHQQQHHKARVRFMQPQESTEQTNLYSVGLFLTCLSLFIAYLISGACFYSKLEDKTLLDGLLISVQLISGGRFPESFTETTQASLALFFSHLLYLYVGLNLASVCVHIGLLCFNQASFIKQETSKTSGYLPEKHHQQQHNVECLPTIQELQDKFNEVVEELPSTIPPYVMNVPPIHQSTTNNQVPVHTRQPQHYQSQLDMMELFVAVNQGPQELHLGTGQPVQAQQQQQLSDLSFASTDRSTEHGSLCLHHQAQYNHHQQQYQNSSSPATSFNTKYATSNRSLSNTNRQHLATTNGYLLDGNQAAGRVQPVDLEFVEETRFGVGTGGIEKWQDTGQRMHTSHSSDHLSAHLTNGFTPVINSRNNNSASGVSTLSRR